MDLKLILHPTNGSRQAAKALELAIDLARMKRARLVVLHVRPTSDSAWLGAETQDDDRAASFDESEAGSRARANELVGQAERKARENGVAEVEGRIVDGHPAREIVAIAERDGADIIVLGSGGTPTAEGLFLGSVATRVAADAPCTCAIVK